LSEILIAHPVVVIEELLKLNMGDEGRLLYLRKAITSGHTIYKSDKEFLKRMHMELDVVKSGKHGDLDTSNNAFSENKNSGISNKFESEITSIQNSISELKNKDSKIKDNLELLSLSREVLSQITIDRSNSFGSFSNLIKNSNADLFSLLTNNPISKKISGVWS
jgi:hypothetical protein